MKKPESIFDRDFEWDALTSFVGDRSDGATLGIVSGRRRQGKTHLLQEICSVGDGFYFAATEATSTDSLRLFAQAHAEFTNARLPLALSSWDDAIETLLDLGAESKRPVPVVIDEFPYLCQANRALPSIIQKVLAPRSRLRLRSRTRLILCGSAITFMGNLLSGSAPLRGRAGLDLRVPTFDPRTAAAFWGFDDWRLAFRVHAIVGGTPAYRLEYVRGDTPRNLADFDPWVCRTVLNPASPLRQEARHLLAEEGGLRDPGLYHSVLAAIADGQTSRGGIAKYTGRPADTLRHPITVLEDAGLVVREVDALRQNRPYHRIAEPLITFYHLIMRPELSRLERPGQAPEVWSESQERFTSGVLGPHFEAVARWWTATHASAETLGGRPALAVDGVVNDQRNRTNHQIDVVAVDSRRRVLALGEAKLGATMGVGHLNRLAAIRDLLSRTGRDISDQCRLLCFSGAGFTPELVAAADRGEAVLVDLDRLYTGS